MTEIGRTGGSAQYHLGAHIVPRRPRPAGWDAPTDAVPPIPQFPRRSAGSAESDGLMDELPAMGQGRRRGLLTRLLLAMVIVGFVGIAWNAYRLYRSSESGREVPLITASAQPVRVAPDDPGGLEIPHQDRLVLNAAPGQAAVEVMVEAPERPLEREVADTDSAPPPAQGVPAEIMAGAPENLLEPDAAPLETATTAPGGPTTPESGPESEIESVTESALAAAQDQPMPAGASIIVDTTGAITSAGTRDVPASVTGPGLPDTGTADPATPSEAATVRFQPSLSESQLIQLLSEPTSPEPPPPTEGETDLVDQNGRAVPFVVRPPRNRPRSDQLASLAVGVAERVCGDIQARRDECLVRRVQ